MAVPARDGSGPAAKRGVKGHASLLTDCQAAVLAVRATGDRTACPGLARDIRQLLQQTLRVGIKHTWIWVPSHGTSPNWTPPAGHVADHLRALNARVDETGGCQFELSLARIPSAKLA